MPIHILFSILYLHKYQRFEFIEEAALFKTIQLIEYRPYLWTFFSFT